MYRQVQIGGYTVSVRSDDPSNIETSSSEPYPTERAAEVDPRATQTDAMSFSCAPLVTRQGRDYGTFYSTQAPPSQGPPYPGYPTFYYRFVQDRSFLDNRNLIVVHTYNSQERSGNIDTMIKELPQLSETEKQKNRTMEQQFLTTFLYSGDLPDFRGRQVTDYVAAFTAACKSVAKHIPSSTPFYCRPLSQKEMAEVLTYLALYYRRDGEYGAELEGNQMKDYVPCNVLPEGDSCGSAQTT